MTSDIPTKVNILYTKNKIYKGMDQLKWTTPSKSESKREGLIISSPRLYKTPVKQCEAKLKHTTYHNNTGCFTVLPTHITPPSGLTKFIARNPFEPDLTNRLHLSVISPTVFRKVSSPPSPHSSGFAWSIEELALMQPAKIEEFPTQQMHCVDPEAEVKAQAAIDQFFNENQIIPSPWEIRKRESRLKMNVDTPTRASSELNSESPKSKKDGWSQTVLCLPPELPPHVEEALKPYFTFTQEQNVENDDANSSNSSLRRKLFFNHEDCLENDEESSIYLSPVKMNGSLVLSCSPPQSGMLIHGTPLKCSQRIERNHGTPVVISQNLSPPNMSPIHSTINNMSCESIKSRSRSVARLDFTTDMSIDNSILQNKEYNNHSIDESFCKAEIQTVEKKIHDALGLDTNSMCVQLGTSSKIEVMPRNSTLFENNAKNGVTGFSNKHHNIANTLKLLTDSGKFYTNESCVFQQTNVLLGISDQQSVSNSVQDTGYQTYSMSSTANVTDSYNSTPVKQKIYWGDRILLPEEELRLSDWKENVKNIFSSTPSKSNREQKNHIH